MWKKISRAGQAIGDNTKRCTRIACWETKATDVLSKYVKRLLTANASQCYGYMYIACKSKVNPCTGTEAVYRLYGL